jgi:hypothetical protein
LSCPHSFAHRLAAGIVTCSGGDAASRGVDSVISVPTLD